MKSVAERKQKRKSQAPHTWQRWQRWQRRIATDARAGHLRTVQGKIIPLEEVWDDECVPVIPRPIRVSSSALYLPWQVESEQSTTTDTGDSLSISIKGRPPAGLVLFDRKLLYEILFQVTVAKHEQPKRTLRQVLNQGIAIGHLGDISRRWGVRRYGLQERVQESIDTLRATTLTVKTPWAAGDERRVFPSLINHAEAITDAGGRRVGWVVWPNPEWVNWHCVGEGGVRFDTSIFQAFTDKEVFAARLYEIIAVRNGRPIAYGRGKFAEATHTGRGYWSAARRHIQARLTRAQADIERQTNRIPHPDLEKKGKTRFASGLHFKALRVVPLRWSPGWKVEIQVFPADKKDAGTITHTAYLDYKYEQAIRFEKYTKDAPPKKERYSDYVAPPNSSKIAQSHAPVRVAPDGYLGSAPADEDDGECDDF